MKHKLFWVCFSLLLLVMTPAWGQTEVVKRPSKTTKAKSDYSPTDMKNGIYYMCIMESWNLTNSRATCRKMAAKGYSPALVQIAREHDMGYFVCIKQFKDKTSAEQFAKTFSDERYQLAYIFYNNDLKHFNQNSGVIE